MGQGKRPDHQTAARLTAPRTKISIDDTLAALADPARRRVIELLRGRPRRAGELAEALELSPAAMSRHLRQLRYSGLVEETHPEFDARVRVYSLKSGAMAELKDWLAQTEAMWTTELAALKGHVEKGAR